MDHLFQLRFQSQLNQVQINQFSQFWVTYTIGSKKALLAVPVVAAAVLDEPASAPDTAAWVCWCWALSWGTASLSSASEKKKGMLHKLRLDEICNSRSHRITSASRRHYGNLNFQGPYTRDLRWVISGSRAVPGEWTGGHSLLLPARPDLRRPLPGEHA